ncbi:uncharacterized protein LOC135490911 [Lineus longissimus]|uniref:uncharacterized protein LOC135490911 n=1 Tax=Lineus longissimus TaxID=88925 RepID=UPI00315D91E4
MALVDKIFKLSYIGSNHAGFEADSSAAVLTSEANNDINDCVEWPLGTIRNSGEKSGKAHNTVQIRILAKLLSTDDDILWVTVGVKYCESWLWVAQIRFNVVQELPSYVEPKLINFVVRSPMRRADIYENGTYVYWLDVHIPPGTQYKPLKIDIAGPYYDKALLEVCVAKIMHVGDKIKGFNASNFNPDFVSTGGNDINDRVIFTLGQLSNVGTEDADEFWMLNIVRVQVVVSMTVHNTSINYTKTSASPYCVAFGCRYDAKKLWVGSTCLERGDIMPDIEKGEPEPKVEQVELKSSPKVKYGEAFGYEIVLLVPYGTTAVYTCMQD